MFKSLTLRGRLLSIGITVTAVPLLVVTLLTWQSAGRMEQAARQGCDVLSYDDLDHVASSVVAMCEASRTLIERQAATSLNAATEMLTRTGAIAFHPEEKAKWKAVNQVTQAAQDIELPKMTLASTWLGAVSEPNTPAPFVDDVRRVVGGTCTVFQRMNDAGDMLRVCTNVISKDGKRAIGTYIPTVQADGTANPVLSSVLAGKTYTGRAFVVDGWYATGYSPLKDAQGKVIGMLYVGTPESQATAGLRKSIMEIKVGKTGYIYVLNAAGATKGQYVISKDGKRDGENIWEAKDSAGNLFIQDICNKALKLQPGQIAEQQYPWKNTGDTAARMKVARIAYFQPWDWAIGVGSYIEEFHETAQAIAEANHQSLRFQFLVTGAALLAAVVIWLLVANRLSKRISAIVQRVDQGAEQVASSSGQVSASSQSLAQGASEQAAALEETTSSLEEMSSMTKKNAESAQQAAALAASTKEAADKGNHAMHNMNDGIAKIQKSAAETAKIIKVIDEIAFQTNLLALNAAVEAARAGEAGKGFAVVAEEVRNLAMRSAEAAKNTASMIEESVNNAKNGVAISADVGKTLDEITSSIGKVNALVSEIAAASSEQAQGISQVNTAVAEMDKVTQSNAANAEESASAAEEMTSLAEQLRLATAELAAIVQTKSSHTHTATRPQQPPSHTKPARLEAAPSQNALDIPVADELTCGKRHAA